MIEKLSKFKLSLTAKIFFVLLDIIAIIYTINNRSIYDFIKYSLIIDTSIIIIILGFLFFLLKKIKLTKSFGKILFPSIFYFILLGPIYYSLFVLLKDFILKLQSFYLPNYLVISTTILLTLMAGFLLFYFRLQQRFLYGVSEAVVGVLIAVDKITHENLQDFSNSKIILVFLTASVYLIVRGFDNIHQSFTKTPIDPLSSNLLSLLNYKKI